MAFFLPNAINTLRRIMLHETSMILKILKTILSSKTGLGILISSSCTLVIIIGGLLWALFFVKKIKKRCKTTTLIEQINFYTNEAF
ncbi:hypothetical protein HZS_2727 [Henneguya salminicola]|nr:hypothetical protein HZS_2727 [Henneguya salminicola]